MPLLPSDTLYCPIDSLPMQRQHNTWRCPSGHSYDIAKQGYVNLLPVQSKKSRDPGDSRAMVNARRAFLDGGHFAPIADAVSRAVTAALPQPDLSLLDAGCGEAYYLDTLCTELLADKRELQACALDISKWAVRSAMQRNRGFTGIVASNRQIPLASNSQDLILCMFGFPVFGEFSRLLKSGGVLLTVDSGPRHLIELRRALYDEVTVHAPQASDEATAHIGPVLAEHALSYTTSPLSRESLAQLLQMTPHYYRATAAGRERATALTLPEVTVDVVLRLFRRADNTGTGQIHAAGR